MTTRSFRAAAMALLLGYLPLTLPGLARAAEPAITETPAEDKAAAQVLFDEGRALMEQEQYAEACPKFAESQRLDPALGTQLNLARCYHLVGRTASAWALYLEAATVAKREGQANREQVARQLAEELAPKLSRLTVEVPYQLEGLTIRRDGTTLREVQWGAAMPVDPGDHVLEASAPGYETWTTTVSVEADGGQSTVTIERLAPKPEEPNPDGAPVTGPGPEQPDPTSLLASGAVVGGLGLVGVGLGIAFGVVAGNQYDDSLAHCHADDVNVCSQEGVDIRNDARTSGNVSTAGFIAGGAMLVTGAVLVGVALAHDASEPGSVEPNAEPAGDTISVRLLPWATGPASQEGTGPVGAQGGLLLRGWW